MEGFVRGLTGMPLFRETEANYRFTPKVSAAAVSIDTRVFGYCTEVNVSRVKAIPKEDLSRFLEEKGNSIALVCEDDFLKLHIHTDVPAEIIEYMKTLGTVEHVKIDNLVEEISRFSALEDPDAECAVMAFIPGEGFRDIYASLGVKHCIFYTSHLPSAGEILEHLDAINEKNIIVLPNNDNILPAVMLAAEKATKHLAVIHTGNIIQGIAAAYGYSGNDGVEDNVKNMKDCMGLARGIFIYKSSAVSEFDGQVIRKGDYFAIFNGTLAATGASLGEVTIESMEQTGLDGISNIALYYQDPLMRTELEAIRQQVAGTNNNYEIEILDGRQFRESLIISLE
jgi:uncharacterized protein